MSPPDAVHARELAGAARDCAALARARALSAWVGPGREVTAAGVLRRWLRALRAVLASESVDRDRVGAALACRAVLGVLGSAEVRDVHELEHRVGGVLAGLDPDRAFSSVGAFRRERRSATGALEVLTGFGAVDRLRVTPLGRWALQALTDDIGAAAPAVLPSAHGDHSVCRLKIGLQGFRPPVWRRVLVPSGARLGDLHDVVQAVVEWDDDHLHVFTADGRQYSDLAHGPDGWDDEDARTLADVLPWPGTSIDYRYDLGDCWDHTIALEEVLERDGSRTHPVCVGGRGDAPVEDWVPEDGEPTVPFDRAQVDRRLAALGRRGAAGR